MAAREVASADRAGDEPARTDATSSEDAAGGHEARQGEFRIPGMHDSEETEYPAKAKGAFYAAVAKPEGDEETPGSRTRVYRQTTQRETVGADHRRTDTRSSRLGELFPDGKCRPGVQQNGLLRGQKPAAVAVPARWATANEASAIHRRSAIRDGFAQVDGHSEVSDASHAQKIIVKPWAGK